MSYACPIRGVGVGVAYSLGLVGFADRLGGAPSAEIVSSLKTAAETLSNLIRDDAGSSSVWAAAEL